MERSLGLTENQIVDALRRALEQPENPAKSWRNFVRKGALTTYELSIALCWEPTPLYLKKVRLMLRPLVAAHVLTACVRKGKVRPTTKHVAPARARRDCETITGASQPTPAYHTCPPWQRSAGTLGGPVPGMDRHGNPHMPWRSVPGTPNTMTRHRSRVRQPIQDLEGGHSPCGPVQGFILPIPWISQHGPTAKHTADDCGPACIAMTVHYLTDETPTVDQVSLSGGIPAGAEWSSLRQLQRAARCFGIRAQFVRPMMQSHIKTQIQKGLPCVALVKYDELDPEQPPRAHFILLVGFTPKTVIYHDPNLAEEDGEFVEVPWAQFKRAHDTTSKTPGNTFNNHGIIFHA